MSRTSKALVLQKQERAMSLLRSGQSYEEIATALGYASRASAWRLVQNALQSLVQRESEGYVALELARLDALHAANWEAAISGDYKAANLVLRLMDTRIRLTGLDRPDPSHGAPCSVACPVLYATRNATSTQEGTSC
jgi:hypothetical protein